MSSISSSVAYVPYGIRETGKYVCIDCRHIIDEPMELRSDGLWQCPSCGDTMTREEYQDVDREYIKSYREDLAEPLTRRSVYRTFLS
jgi:ribosomal protein L37AE/L43A